MMPDFTVPSPVRTQDLAQLSSFQKYNKKQYKIIQRGPLGKEKPVFTKFATACNVASKLCEFK